MGVRPSSPKNFNLYHGETQSQEPNTDLSLI